MFCKASSGSTWERNLEGKLHRVRVANAALIKPAEFKFSSGLYHLH